MKRDDLIDEIVEAAREGFLAAERAGRDKWYVAVNACPYGPALPGEEESSPLAHAWYDGFWFFNYVVGPLRKAARNTTYNVHYYH